MRAIFTILISSSFIFANSLVYKVYAPLFGEVGKIEVNYNNTSKNYNISAFVQTYGFAKKLSGNRVEKYKANGFISNNIYKAKHFVQDVSYKDKKSHLEYIFDYKAKKIYKIRQKYKKNKEVTNYKKALKYFTYNDLFSVYHNIIATLKDKPAGHYRVKVAGMERYGGYLSIKIPSKAVQKKEAKSMGLKSVWIFHIVTNKKILGSKNGEIIFGVGSNGIAKGVRVLDIPFVSHLDAKLVR